MGSHLQAHNTSDISLVKELQTGNVSILMSNRHDYFIDMSDQSNYYILSLTLIQCFAGDSAWT